eukprot:1399745-Amphidinium_carterae.1
MSFVGQVVQHKKKTIKCLGDIKLFSVLTYSQSPPKTSRWYEHKDASTMWDLMKLVKQWPARSLLIENVPSIGTKKNDEESSALEILLKELEEANY